MHDRAENDDEGKIDLSVSTPGSGQSWPGALTLLGFFALIGFIVWVCCSAGGRFGPT